LLPNNAINYSSKSACDALQNYFFHGILTTMMTVQQTINIPSDRWLHMELPKTVPSGKFDLRLIFTPMQTEAAKWEAPIAPNLAKKQHDNQPLTVAEARTEIARKKLCRRQDPSYEDSSHKYAGCLNGRNVFKGDPVEIQRKMRDEWD
jgi:hypothetical protein